MEKLLEGNHFGEVLVIIQERNHKTLTSGRGISEAEPVQLVSDPLTDGKGGRQCIEKDSLMPSLDNDPFICFSWE